MPTIKEIIRDLAIAAYKIGSFQSKTMSFYLNQAMAVIILEIPNISMRKW